MTYAVYRNFTNNIARYHVYEVHSLGDGKTSNDDWRHNLPGLDAVFRTALEDPRVRAVVPCRLCMPGSTEAKCIGCYDA